MVRKYKDVIERPKYLLYYLVFAENMDSSYSENFKEIWGLSTSDFKEQVSSYNINKKEIEPQGWSNKISILIKRGLIEKSPTPRQKRKSWYVISSKGAVTEILKLIKSVSNLNVTHTSSVTSILNHFEPVGVWNKYPNDSMFKVLEKYIWNSFLNYLREVFTPLYYHNKEFLNEMHNYTLKDVFEHYIFTIAGNYLNELIDPKHFKHEVIYVPPKEDGFTEIFKSACLLYLNFTRFKQVLIKDSNSIFSSSFRITEGDKHE